MMRAISLHQPYASLMAKGIKKIETRGRLTHVRGELAICASQKRMVVSSELRSILRKYDMLGDLPRGCVVGVCNLAEVVPTEVLIQTAQVGEEEKLCGYYAADRWGWRTENMRAMLEPVPVRGFQGFFFLPADVEQKVRAQLMSVPELKAAIGLLKGVTRVIERLP